MGVGFQNLSNAGQYSGATNDTLIITNTSLSNNNQLFRCIISNGTCTDTSNTVTLSVIDNTGLNEIISDKIKIYPNPSSGNIHFTFNDFSGQQKTIRLLSELGLVLMEYKTVENELDLDFSQYASGIYFITIQTSQGSFNRKIIIRK